MTFVDFASLPPEVNSGRMYAGAGAAPLQAAAAGWQGLSAQLDAAAVSYGKVLAELTDAAWHGPSAASMASTVEPYVAWMNTMAAQAAEVASQAQQAVAAYEAAFAATVPPEVVAANRTILTALVATNVLGQNAAAIAANQAEYAEMWAQDAAAMHGYAASAAAAELPALSAAPQNGQAAQSSDSSDLLENMINANGPIAQMLKAFAQSPLMDAANTHFNWLASTSGDFSGFMWFATMFPQAVEPLYSSAILFGWPFFKFATMASTATMAADHQGDMSHDPSAVAGMLAGSYAANPVAANSNGASASLARATAVGGLSVPPSWGTSLAETRLASAVTSALGAPQVAGPAAAAQGRIAGLGAVPGLAGLGGGMPVVGSVVNTPKQGDGKTSGGKPVAGQATGLDDGNWPEAPRTASALSERDELNKLRKANTDLVAEREALRRAAALVAKQ